VGISQNLAVIGLFRQERRHELIANNLSNAQTAGFKKDVPVFHKIFSEAFSSYQLGEFETSVTSFQQGELQTTRNPLDLAVEGEGFFKVKTPQGIRYTRSGNFRLNREGILVQDSGYPVLGRTGEMNLKGNQFSIDKDGTVYVDGASRDKIALVTFADLNGLKKEGQALFKLEGEQEEKEVSQSQVHQGTMELSNINIMEEMVRMIDALRSFEACRKIVQVQDEMDAKAVNELAKG
jgi:flagellar basal-body rod protein FlgF